MIKSFKHKGLKKFFETGVTAGIQAAHIKKLRAQLIMLDSAKSPEDMNLPGWDWHPLKGFKPKRWSVHVNGNWCITYEFENGDAYIVDYEDYH